MTDQAGNEFADVERVREPRITVVGVGGAGGNAVDNMIRADLPGVDFLAANTDAQALAQSLCEEQIQLGLSLTQGLGAGSRPDIGQAAAEEALEAIARSLHGATMTFITAGMGGGTGTGGAPVIARAAREQGALTVGVVTKPFDFEGNHRIRQAEAGIAELEQYVDTLIVIPNQNLFLVADEKTTFADAFKLADDVLHSAIRGVTDLMVLPGLVNLDFADVRSIMAGMGKAVMGTGEAEGDNRAIEAAEAAIANPLLGEVSMAGARSVLVNISGGRDLKLREVDEAANRIRAEVDPDANIIFGSAISETLDGTIRVSVIATGNAAQQTERIPPATGGPFVGEPAEHRDTNQIVGTEKDSGANRVATSREAESRAAEPVVQSIDDGAADGVAALEQTDVPAAEPAVQSLEDSVTDSVAAPAQMDAQADEPVVQRLEDGAADSAATLEPTEDRETDPPAQREGGSADNQNILPENPTPASNRISAIEAAGELYGKPAQHSDPAEPAELAPDANETAADELITLRLVSSLPADDSKADTLSDVSPRPEAASGLPADGPSETTLSDVEPSEAPLTAAAPAAAGAAETPAEAASAGLSIDMEGARFIWETDDQTPTDDEPAKVSAPADPEDDAPPAADEPDGPDRPEVAPDEASQPTPKRKKGFSLKPMFRKPAKPVKTASTHETFERKTEPAKPADAPLGKMHFVVWEVELGARIYKIPEGKLDSIQNQPNADRMKLFDDLETAKVEASAIFKRVAAERTVKGLPNSTLKPTLDFLLRCDEKNLPDYRF